MEDGGKISSSGSSNSRQSVLTVGNDYDNDE